MFELNHPYTQEDLHEIIMGLGYEVKAKGKYFCRYENPQASYQVVSMLHLASRQDLTVSFYATDQDRLNFRDDFRNGVENLRIRILRFYMPKPPIIEGQKITPKITRKKNFQKPK